MTSHSDKYGQPIEFDGRSRPPTRPDPVTYQKLANWSRLKTILKHGRKCHSSKSAANIS
jgi:hypothetical protein